MANGEWSDIILFCGSYLPSFAARGHVDQSPSPNYIILWCSLRPMRASDFDRGQKNRIVFGFSEASTDPPTHTI